MKKEVPRLAKKLRMLRSELRLTQKEVADRASVTESAYRAYELGDRNPKPGSTKENCGGAGGSAGIFERACIRESP